MNWSNFPVSRACFSVIIMRFYIMGIAMSHQENREKSPPSWLTVFVVVAAVAVSYVGFARVSVEWTLVIASAIFIALVLFLWRAGVRKERDNGRGR